MLQKAHFDKIETILNTTQTYLKVDVFLLLDYNRNYSHSTGPTSPRGQVPYTNTEKTMVSPDPGPDQLVPSPPRGRTPARDRQRSVPGQLVPSSTGGPAHQGSQPVPKLTVVSAVTPLVTIDQPALGQALNHSGNERPDRMDRGTSFGETP